MAEDMVEETESEQQIEEEQAEEVEPEGELVKEAVTELEAESIAQADKDQEPAEGNE